MQTLQLALHVDSASRCQLVVDGQTVKGFHPAHRKLVLRYPVPMLKWKHTQLRMTVEQRPQQLPAAARQGHDENMVHCLRSVSSNHGCEDSSTSGCSTL